MAEKKQVMREHFKERVGLKRNISMTPDLPDSLNIEVNNTCNHRCVFCGYHSNYVPDDCKIEPAVLDVQFVKDIMKQAWSLGIGRKEIGFYIAGEPLLYNGLVEVTAYAKELGYPYIFMTTNGALATPEKMKALIDAGLNSIRFSVNAPDRERYAEAHGRDDFDTVIENIKWVHEYITGNNKDVATAVTCVLTKRTNGCQKDMISLLGEYVDDVAFIPVMLTRLGCVDEVRDRYELISDATLKTNHDYICPVLFNTMYIDAFGRVIPCCNSYNKVPFCADLKQNPSLVDAWNSETYKRLRGIFVENLSDKGTICEKCYGRMKSPDDIIMGYE